VSVVLVTSLLFLLLPVGAGIALLSRHQKLMRGTMRVRGRTLNPREHPDPLDATCFTTVVEYAVNNVRYVIEAKGMSDCKWCHREGRTVWVYYTPGKPAAGQLAYWWLPLVYWLPILLAGYVAYVLFNRLPA
jgi:hypothetical protein